MYQNVIEVKCNKINVNCTLEWRSYSENFRFYCHRFSISSFFLSLFLLIRVMRIWWNGDGNGYELVRAHQLRFVCVKHKHKHNQFLFHEIFLDKDNARSDVAHGKYLFRPTNEKKNWENGKCYQPPQKWDCHEYMRYLVTNQDGLLEWNHFPFLSKWISLSFQLFALVSICPDFSLFWFTNQFFCLSTSLSLGALVEIVIFKTIQSILISLRIISF